MDLSPLAITLRDSAGMMSFALSYGVDCPLLSVGFIVLMNFGLSAFAVNLLSNVETILSDVLSNAIPSAGLSRSFSRPFSSAPRNSATSSPGLTALSRRSEMC